MKIKSLLISILLSLILVPLVSAEENTSVTVTTSFIQDMVKRLSDDQIQTQLLIPRGSDPHLYQPKPSDLQALNQADLVLYHGLHFEGKFADVLEKFGQAITQDIQEKDLIVSGEGHLKSIDPHFWFDISLYKQAVQTTSRILQDKYPQLAPTIQGKEKDYLQDLDQLDQEIKDMIGQIPSTQRVLISPHDAFSYFGRAYGFELMAPQGTSTETQASNQQIARVVDTILTRHIPAIFLESTSNPKVMDKITEAVEQSGGQVTLVKNPEDELLTDSLAQEGEEGDTYLDMYRRNIRIIHQYLLKEKE